MIRGKRVKQVTRVYYICPICGNDMPFWKKQEKYTCKYCKNKIAAEDILKEMGREYE